MTAPPEQTASSPTASSSAASSSAGSSTSEPPVAGSSQVDAPVIGPVDTVTRVDPPGKDISATTEAPESAPTDAPRSAEGEGGPPSGQRWWWRIGFPVALLVLVVAIPALLYAGARVVLSSHGGNLITAVTDPAAPGWEAVVDTTPTMAVANLDAAGGLDSVTILSLTGDGSGGVVQVPGSTVVDIASIGEIPLSILYEKSGPDGLKRGLDQIIGSAIGEIEVVDAAQWATLTKPVGPLAISNPDPVTKANAFGQPEVVFPKGSIDVAPDQVWSYLSMQSPGENELSRMIRHEAFWRAWLAQVGTSSSPDQAVPGEVESGFGRFVRGLASDQVEFATLPVNRTPVPGASTEVYKPQTDQIRQLFAHLVPFPNGSEGTRPRLRVLDGTGKLDHGIDVAIALAADGAQINKIGNAERFDLEKTQFIYYDDAMQPKVQQLRDTLGFGELVKSDAINEAVDAMVVLGADAIGARTGPPQPTTVGTGG